MTGAAQSYVDEEIRHHEEALAAGPIVEGLQTHGRALVALRRLRRQQYRPQLPAPAQIAQPVALREVDRPRREVDRLQAFRDVQAPATSPLYALTAQRLGLDPSQR